MMLWKWWKNSLMEKNCFPFPSGVAVVVCCCCCCGEKKKIAVPWTTRSGSNCPQWAGEDDHWHSHRFVLFSFSCFPFLLPRIYIYIAKKGRRIFSSSPEQTVFFFIVFFLFVCVGRKKMPPGQWVTDHSPLEGQERNKCQRCIDGWWRWARAWKRNMTPKCWRPRSRFFIF